jgi:hypothetical protein
MMHPGKKREDVVALIYLDLAYKAFCLLVTHATKIPRAYCRLGHTIPRSWGPDEQGTTLVPVAEFPPHWVNRGRNPDDPAGIGHAAVSRRASLRRCWWGSRAAK